MASRVTDFAGTYPARETGGITILCDYLHIQPGLTAIIGGGGKTTLLRVLANELSAQARVIVSTSTKMMMPEWCPALIDPSLGEVQEALSDRQRKKKGIEKRREWKMLKTDRYVQER